MPGSDSFVEFLGKRYKLNICNVDGVTEPSAIVPLNKHKSEAEKKISICERTLKNPAFKEKSERQFEIAVWFCLDPETHNFRIAGMRQDASVATPKSPEASKVDEQSSTCEHLIKDVPSKEKTEPKMKVPTSFGFDSEAHTFRITGLRQDVSVTDAISKQSPEAPTCKPKSKVEKKKMTCKSSISLPFKEKTEPEFEVPTQVNFDPKPLAFSITGKKENFSKKFSDACMCKPNTNVEEKMLT
ncbi:unnamed protein product [Larinioides sclopetarius]|uniref:Uncharacterized protein n=1 Tax=Larinioides sclopetarius TaxID=280406 RepID=A0AAV1Z5Z0_9ARAC